MRTALTFVILGALSTPAFAQTATPAASPAAAAGAAAVGAAPNGTTLDASGKLAMTRVEQHITELYKRLAISPAQQPQWDKFAGVMRDNAQRMEASYTDRASHYATLSAVGDMKSYAAISRAHADNVDRLIPAFETLYSSMSAEQKAAADKTFQNFQRGPGAMRKRHQS